MNTGPNRRGGQPQKWLLTDEIRETILAEYDSHNGKALAARFGVPAWRIRRWAAELGVARIKEPRWSESDASRAIAPAAAVSGLGVRARLRR